MTGFCSVLSWIPAPVWDGIYVVRGNCDYDSGYPERLVVKLGDVIIAQTHGHLYGINFTWDS